MYDDEGEFELGSFILNEAGIIEALADLEGTGDGGHDKSLIEKIINL